MVKARGSQRVQNYDVYSLLLQTWRRLKKKQLHKKPSTRKEGCHENTTTQSDSSDNETGLINDNSHEDDGTGICYNALYSRFKPGECWLRCMHCLVGLMLTALIHQRELSILFVLFANKFMKNYTCDFVHMAWTK